MLMAGTSTSQANSPRAKQWVSRTKHIGDELAPASIKKLKGQKKKLAEVEEECLSKQNAAKVLKHVLHRGFWKYKKEHYQDQLTTLNKAQKISPAEAFNNAIDKAL